MIKNILEKLGYDYEQFEYIIHANAKHLVYTGQMWDVKDDVIMDILYEEFFDDVNGACEIIDMLEEEFKYEDGSFNEYLYYALIFRDRNISE